MTLPGWLTALMAGVTAVVKGWLGYRQEQAERTDREEAVIDRLKIERKHRDETDDDRARDLDRWLREDDD